LPLFAASRHCGGAAWAQETEFLIDKGHGFVARNSTTQPIEAPQKNSVFEDYTRKSGRKFLPESDFTFF
jgi:hypothetical protein